MAPVAEASVVWHISEALHQKALAIYISDVHLTRVAFRGFLNQVSTVLGCWDEDGKT